MKEKYKEVEHKGLNKILLHNFLGGVAWGLGITVGATIIVAIGGFLISQIDYVPFFGNFVLEIVEFVEQNNPRL